MALVVLAKKAPLQITNFQFSVQLPCSRGYGKPEQAGTLAGNPLWRHTVGHVQQGLELIPIYILDPKADGAVERAGQRLTPSHTQALGSQVKCAWGPGVPRSNRKCSLYLASEVHRNHGSHN